MRSAGDDERGRLADHRHMSPDEILARLLELQKERVAAEQVGLTADVVYMADLEAEVLAYRLAFVTEIAVSRGELFGRNFG
jgi:hypothetical protein